MPFVQKAFAKTNTATYSANVPFFCTIQNNEANIAMTYEPVNSSYSSLTARPTDNLSISSNGLVDISLDIVSQSGLEIQSTSMYLLIDNAFSRLYGNNSLSYQAPSPRVPYIVSSA